MSNGITITDGVVRWAHGARLERLSSGHTEYFPRLESMHLAPREVGRRPLVLVGEEGAGESEFVRSLRVASTELALLQFDLEDFDGLSQTDLNRFMSVEDQPLDIWLRKSADPGRVVIKGLDRMEDPMMATKLLAKLRRVYDGQEPPSHTSLVIFVRDARILEVLEYSYIVSVSDFCRLPRLQVDELICLLAEKLDVGQVDLTSKSVELSRLTGGHPLLTSLLLSKLTWQGEVDLRQAMIGVRDYPPAVLASWRQRLARIIERDREIKSFVGDLIKGQEYEIDGTDPAKQAPYQTRALSLAGWMAPSVTADGGRRVWRFSELHRFWAAPVLREPRRFLPVGGDR